MPRRPNDEWTRRVGEADDELARGTWSPEEACAGTLWPESLWRETDAALAGFEAGLRALTQPSEEEILTAVERLVLTLNKVNDEHVRTGKIGYESGERDELCGSAVRLGRASPGVWANAIASGGLVPSRMY